MRSKLFVPGVRPDLFAKALGSAADAICFDLEEAVPQEKKSDARDVLDAFLTSAPCGVSKRLLVRVNPVGSADFAKDLQAIVKPELFAIALPKVETVDEVRQAAELLSAIEKERGIELPIAMLITVESPRGLRSAYELAFSTPRIFGLQLGFADLLEPLGISSDHAAARQQIRLMLRLAAGEAGLECYEAAYPMFRDKEGFLAECAAARALGFAGVSCIHPDQVDVANQVFSPTPDEIAYAEAVVAAAEKADQEGSSIAVVNGKMIDRPFILRARGILQRSAK